MPIDITMPALSPTMETGTLAKWLVKVGDPVKSGDILCEIETDKATMEVESIDEGTVAELLVADGTEDIKVGAVIARLTAEGEAAADPPLNGEGDRAVSGAVEGRSSEAATPAPASPPPTPTATMPAAQPDRPSTSQEAGPPPRAGEAQVAADPTRTNASPLARRLAAAAGLDLSTLTGSGPHGRIVKSDVDAAAARPRASVHPAAEPTVTPAANSAAPAPRDTPAPQSAQGATHDTSRPTAAAAALPAPAGVPMEAVKLSNMRKTIARRLAELKATVPHFYQSVDIRLDALLKLRGELNASLQTTGIKLSVNDLLIKALGLALVHVPDANVQFAGSELYRFARADISVAVAIPGGLITPVITDAANKRPSVIASEMKDLATRAKDGKLKPEEYQGGTASLSNLGMFGIKQFDAVINPPQGLILAIGAGEPRPYVVDNALAIATVMTATGSFDHRAIDGSVGAQLMGAFKDLVEAPMGMLA